MSVLCNLCSYFEFVLITMSIFARFLAFFSSKQCLSFSSVECRNYSVVRGGEQFFCMWGHKFLVLQVASKLLLRPPQKKEKKVIAPNWPTFLCWSPKKQKKKRSSSQHLQTAARKKFRIFRTIIDSLGGTLGSLGTKVFVWGAPPSLAPPWLRPCLRNSSY